MEEGTRVDGKMSWIWRKGFSMGKKILALALIVSSAPFIVPPLVVASIIALISSLPFSFFLLSYVFIEKLMRKLLPSTAFGGRGDKMMLFRNKIGRYGDIYNEYGEGVQRVVNKSEPVLDKTDEEVGIGARIDFREEEEEDRAPLMKVAKIVVDESEYEDMKKESKSLLESIRDEDRTNQSLDRGISEKGFGKGLSVSTDVKSEKVGAGTKKVSGTRHEGKLESTTTKASRGKNMEKSSNELKVMYSEEQIWAKMETLRKIVGYSVERNTTCSEELKALYMFTGVELPTSMLEKENQDMAQVSERLYFLMSVIGVK